MPKSAAQPSLVRRRPQPGARRAAERGARARGPAVQLLGQGHRGAGGAGAGAQAPGHVHRRHRRARAAPPVRRGARQRHGRGGRRPRQADRGQPRRRRRADRQGRRPRHAGRPAPEVPGQVGARGHHDHAALGREVLRQGLRDLRRPARRRRLGGQRPLRAGRGDGLEGRLRVAPDLLAAASRPRSSSSSAPPASTAPRSPSRPTR